MNLLKEFEILDDKFKKQRFILAKDILLSIHPKWVAKLFIFLIKRSSEFDFCYTWVGLDGKEGKAQYRFEVPSEFRLKAELLFFLKNQNTENEK